VDIAELMDLDGLELHEALEVARDAFAEEPVVVDLVRELAEGGAVADGIVVVAIDGASISGFVLLTEAHIEECPARLMCLAPLAVAPARQRSGVGSALVNSAVRIASERGVGAVFVLGDPAYYGRFGFSPIFGGGIDPPVPLREEYERGWMALELTPGSLDGVRGVVRMAAPLEDPKFW
jgi:putative acetyltransferase